MLAMLACSCSAWPKAATGALWQPPMQGARTTRTPGPSRAGSWREEVVRSHQRAGEAVADANGEGRRLGLAVHHDVEMRIERCDLVHLDEGELHLLGERREMARMEAAEPVLQQMQELDQEVALPRPFAEQRLNFSERLRLDLPSARLVAAAAAARAGMNAALAWRGRGHGGAIATGGGKPVS